MIQPVDYEARRSPTQRLPVNPRRHKVAPEQRKRVATACNNCNVRRIKCSGERPCKQCANSSRDCVYPPPNEKVTVSRSELDDLRRRLDVYERALHDAVPDPTRRGEIVANLGGTPGSPTPSGSGGGSPGSASVVTAGGNAPSTTTPTSSSAATFSHRPSVSAPVKAEPLDDEALLMPGRLLRDQSSGSVARYMGHTSEAAFLDHIKELVIGHWPATNNLFDNLGSPSDQIIGSLGTYATLDGAPLAKLLDVNPLWLPTPPNMAAMLATLRSILQDGSSGELPSGGIHYLSDLTVLPARKAPLSPEDPELSEYRDLALCNAGFALTCQVTNARSSNPGEGSIGEVFFARAAQILQDPLDVSSCSLPRDAAALATMGLYLAEVGRPERSRMYLSAALRVCEMLGLHRGCADEQSKRVFWSAYVLERWSALQLGRPPSLADEHIAVEMPRDVMGMPPAAGLRAHVELARIAGGVVSSGVRSGEDVERAMWLLRSWSASLAPSLQLSGSVSPDPAVCALHMHHHHLVILTVRPVLLNAVKTILSHRRRVHGFEGASQQGMGITLSSHPQAGHIQAAVAAARQSIHLARHVLSLTRRKQLRGSLSELFAAAMVLLLYDVVVSGDRADADEQDEGEGKSSAGGDADEEDEEEDADVEFVIEVYQRVSMTGDKYGTDCVAALRGLQSALGTVKSGQQQQLPSAGENMMNADVFASRGGVTAVTATVAEAVAAFAEGQDWMVGDWPMYDGFMN